MENNNTNKKRVRKEDPRDEIYRDNFKIIDKLGDRLKEARLKKEFYTAKDFADKIHTSLSLLSYIENNNRKPNYKLMYKIKDVLDVNINYLLFNEGEIFAKDTINNVQEIEKLRQELDQTKSNLDQITKELEIEKSKTEQAEKFIKMQMELQKNK